MSAIACKLIRISFPSDRLATLISQINLSGMLEPIEPVLQFNETQYQQELTQSIKDKEIINSAISYLTPYVSGKHKNRKVVVNKTSLKKIIANLLEIQSKAQEVISLYDRKSDLEKKNASIDIELKRYKLIEDVKDPIFAKTELIINKTLVIKAEAFQSFLRSLAHVGDFNSHKLIETNDQVVVLLSYTSEVAAHVEEIIFAKKLITFEPSALVKSDSPYELVQALNSLLSDTIKEINSIDEQLRQLANNYLDQLKIIYDYLSIRIQDHAFIKYVGRLPVKQALTQVAGFNYTEKTEQAGQGSESKELTPTSPEVLLVDGWIDPENLEQFSQLLLKIDKRITVDDISGNSDSLIPTVLKNNRFLRPFQFITTLMGTPGPEEPDPSPFVAPFFVLFFGFALGDAGYGFIMAAVATYFLLIRKAQGQFAEMMKLILYCGVSTILFGILTGGWFGINLSQVGQIGTFLASLKLLDLQSNIILVLTGSLVIGFMHQVLGLLLKMGNLARHHHYKEAVEDPGVWLLLLGAWYFLWPPGQLVH